MNLRTCQECGYSRKIIDTWRSWCFHPSIPTGVIVYSKGKCEGWTRWSRSITAPVIKKKAPKVIEPVFVSQLDSRRKIINKRKYSLPLESDKVKEFIKKLKDH